VRYVIAIEPGHEGQAFGVAVPDLPGCFSAGDTLDEAMTNARDAIELFMDMAVDEGGDIPEPKPLAVHQAKPEFAGWVWAVVEIDPASLSGKCERINITLPRRVLSRLDAAARAAGETRSGYIARLAMAPKSGSGKV